MSGVFKRVGSLRPGRSVFDLSYEKKFTCDMGQLIPVMCDEMVPGDTSKVANQVVIRFQPLVAPIMHEINVYVHYFFVPYRILWDEWEDFITGGVDGESGDHLRAAGAFDGGGERNKSNVVINIDLGGEKGVVIDGEKVG